MARGFGERLAGAGQALQAFDQAYMQARENRLRQRQLRDAELLYNARNARSARMSQTVPGFMLPAMRSRSSQRRSIRWGPIL